MGYTPEPVAIAQHLNHWNDSKHPCLTDSGETIVYGMFGGPSLHFDLFYAVRNDTGFGPAIRCDSTINTEWWDSGPSCPADGSILIFERLTLSGGGGAHQLLQARRLSTPIAPQPPRSKRQDMRVVPSFGTIGTMFQIDLPERLAGAEIRIYNVSGQVAALMPASRRDQITYHWKGFTNDQHSIASGLLFVVAQKGKDIETAKIALVK